tara:strand:+ start:1420 stop:1554 length:135 start_codon:yes stop_codon:yes gene_type:complete
MEVVAGEQKTIGSGVDEGPEQRWGKVLCFTASTEESLLAAGDRS